MSLIVPQSSRVLLLDALIASKLEGCFARLFANNIVPDLTTVVGDLVEASFSSYAPVQLVSWPTATLDGSDRAFTFQLGVTFVSSSGGGTGNLYGYYYTDPSGTELYGVERFDPGPISLPDSVPLELNLMYFLSQLS